MATLTNTLTAVRSHLGVASGDGLFTDAILTAFINEALAEIATEHDWPWLQDSETGTIGAGSTYFTPGVSVVYAGTENVTITVSTNVIPLQMRTYDELLQLYPTTQQGQPEAWAVKFEKVQLRPIPDASYVYIHTFIKGEKTLASGSDVPYMPDNYAAALINLTVYIALGRSKEDSRAVAALNHYNAWLSKMLDNRRRNRRPGRIRVRPGSWI